MNISQSTLADINDIFTLYDAATAYQKTVNNKSWSGFDRALIEKEINENRHYKIMEGNEMASTFVVTFEDPVIWDNSDQDKAIYLHRIATDPNYRGRSYIKKIIEWSKSLAKERDIDFIRMDTHSGNDRLNSYYIRSGFVHKGIRDIEWTSDLPEHYKTGPFSLFEMKI
ncbi:GNAT family N-acetyltransferase [Gelidibacter pelagius]|uniref:GNAT family N-acetyltransferase n=1 Tax=Gelidibacter pelagius TaxID=2819985 RepID=A0ABS3SW65_9FLAO|nr:GNAT family N-acetyltransferase [Gelidibacter pelagius]MBO3099941.1 GNAT family N-acetyltransferase [Gelidibacter pelagius]